jgi:hypothetical protein
MADDPLVPPPEPVSTEAPASTSPPSPNPGEAAPGSASTEAVQPSAPADAAGKAPVSDPAKAREEFFAKWKEEDPKTETPEAQPAEEGKEEPGDAASAAGPVDSEPEIEKITNEVASKSSPGEIRKWHNKLVTQRNEARAKIAEIEPLAQLGTDIITTSSAAGWTPKQYVQVMQATVAAHKGDPNAKAQIRAFLGIQAAPAQAWTTEDDNVLTDLVSTGDITGEAAKTLRARFAKAAPVAPPVQPPVQRQPPQDVTPKIADALERATKGVSEADLPVIDAQIKKELDVYRQRHPELSRESYPAVIEAIASGIVQRHKAARQAPAIRQTLRPGSTPTKTPTNGQQTSTKEAFFSRW